MFPKPCRLVFVVCAAWASSASATPFANGSFETPNIGNYSTTVPAAWTVTANGALLSDANGYLGPAASDGAQYMELNVPAGAGAIAQTFDVLAGHDYRLTFDLAGVADGSADTLCVDITAIPGGTVGYCIDTGLTAAFSLSAWTEEIHDFTTAPGQTWSTLSVASTTLSSSGLYYGPAVDNFVLTDLGPASVPEPGTLALLGLGLVGLGVSRRTKKGGAHRF